MDETSVANKITLEAVDMDSSATITFSADLDVYEFTDQVLKPIVLLAGYSEHTFPKIFGREED